MARNNALQKRIKRHLVGRTQTFFVITSPGFESLCYKEVKSLPLPLENVLLMAGGVSFQGRLHECYYANFYLRTASRIIMRIGSFKATNFSQLIKKAEDFPWELYLHRTSVPEISVTTIHSRLFHKKAVEERILSGINKRKALFFENSEDDPENVPQKILIRSEEDVFTISIDTSGDLLYKRGLKHIPAKAPLRETIASSALLLSGYNGRAPLIDPMCGTGTFSLEGAMISKNVPPGFYRNFAFENWPAFKPGRWKHIKEEAEKKFILKGSTCIFASDKDHKACLMLRSHIRELGYGDTVRVGDSDFFELNPSQLTVEKGYVVLNPPYGVRLGTRKESQKLYYEIFRKLKKDYKGWRTAIVIPDKNIEKKIPFSTDSYPFRNGGLKLTLNIGTVV